MDTTGICLYFHSYKFTQSFVLKLAIERFREFGRQICRYIENSSDFPWRPYCVLRMEYSQVTRSHNCYDAHFDTIYREERVRVRGHAATNRVSFFTFCLQAKFRQDVPRVATFNTRTLHVPIKIHVVHDATMLSNPSFPPAFF